MAVTVKAQDVVDAETYITEYLSAAVTDGDYTNGSALRDLAVKAVAGVVALMRKEAQQINVRTSLRNIMQVDTSDDPQAADDAADAIVSNLYATRRNGGYARVMAYGLSSQRTDLTIPKTARFYKTASLAFLLDYGNQDLVVPAESLLAVYDSSGLVTGFQFRFPLVATGVDTDFNVDPGKFAYFDNFSPYLVQVETLEKAQGGTSIETTPALIDRAGTLLTTRNLINARSCDATLLDEFSEIAQLTVIGMGDLEMIRDREREATTGIDVHTGGCQDIFVMTQGIETSFSGTVGGQFARPDGLINVFRDPTYASYDVVDNPTGHKFTDADPSTLRTIMVGTVLRIWEGLPVGPRDYIVKAVHDSYLLVSERTPFPVSTYAQNSTVRWSVGQYMPDYQDVVPQTTTGVTSDQIQTPGCITLPGGPLYRVKDVTLSDPQNVDADPSDGLVHFNVRVNTSPTTQVAPDNQYQVIVHNPEKHQSMQSFTEVRVGTVDSPSAYDGKTLKVTYETLSAFANIDFRVSNRRDRIAAAAPLVRGYHPTYLYFLMEYTPLRSATETLDVEKAITAVSDYIDTFAPTEVIDVTAIMDFFKQTYPTIVGQVYPFVLTYDVYIPDGRLITFQTSDSVRVPADVTKLRALQTAPDDPVEGLLNPLEYGLSDDVICYRALRTQIGIQQR